MCAFGTLFYLCEEKILQELKYLPSLNNKGCIWNNIRYVDDTVLTDERKVKG